MKWQRFHLNFATASQLRFQWNRVVEGAEQYRASDFVRSTLTSGNLTNWSANERLKKLEETKTRPRPRSGRSSQLSVASKFPSDPEECNFSAGFPVGGVHACAKNVKGRRRLSWDYRPIIALTSLIRCLPIRASSNVSQSTRLYSNDASEKLFRARNLNLRDDVRFVSINDMETPSFRYLRYRCFFGSLCEMTILSTCAHSCNCRIKISVVYEGITLWIYLKKLLFREVWGWVLQKFFEGSVHLLCLNSWIWHIL